MGKQTVLAKKRRGPLPTGKGTQVVARMQPAALAELDAWIARQSDPKPSRPEALRKLAELGIATDAAVNERLASAASSTSGKPPAAVTEKTRAKLAAEKPLAPARAERKAAGAARAKELAVGAVRHHLKKVDAPQDEKTARAKRLVKQLFAPEREPSPSRGKK